MKLFCCCFDRFYTPPFISQVLQCFYSTFSRRKMLPFPLKRCLPGEKFQSDPKVGVWWEKQGEEKWKWAAPGWTEFSRLWRALPHSCLMKNQEILRFFLQLDLCLSQGKIPNLSQKDWTGSSWVGAASLWDFSALGCSSLSWTLEKEVNYPYPKKNWVFTSAWPQSSKKTPGAERKFLSSVRHFRVGSPSPAPGNRVPRGVEIVFVKRSALRPQHKRLNWILKKNKKTKNPKKKNPQKKPPNQPKTKKNPHWIINGKLQRCKMTHSCAVSTEKTQNI